MSKLLVNINMYIMYTDESGIENITDGSKYFILSGVIFHENNLAEMKKQITIFKENVFKGKLKDFEIHTHDI